MVPQPAGFSAGNGAIVQDPVGATAHKAWRRAMPPSPGLPLRPHRLGSARIFSHGELAPTLGKIRDPFCQMARALSDSIITSALLKACIARFHEVSRMVMRLLAGAVTMVSMSISWAGEVTMSIFCHASFSELQVLMALPACCGTSAVGMRGNEVGTMVSIG